MGVGPGYSVSKHVKLVRMLGKGGMGSVWVADHLALKTQVAVKFMSERLASDPTMRARFEREATSAAQIGSPHIVNVQDHGITSDGIPYIVMELLEGEDLSDRIKREGPLHLDDVAKIISQTCKALGKAHRRGIVHRDIKPSNLFLLESEGDIFVKVLDFGIATPGSGETSEVTSTGVIVGTVVYASPEQLMNAKRVDFRADLWSLGVVAYRAMTGKFPFPDGDGIGALVMAQHNERFTPPSKLVSTIPPGVDAWFARVFKLAPGDRFESAREMANALYEALGPSESPSLGQPASQASPSSRHVGREASTEGTAERDDVTRQDFAPKERDTSTSTSSYRAWDDEDDESGAAAKAPARPAKAPSPTSTANETSTLGAASAMTYVGENTSSTNAKGGSGGRKVLVAAAVLMGLAGAGVGVFLFSKRPVHTNAPSPSVAEPSTVPEAPAEVPAAASAEVPAVPPADPPAPSAVEPVSSGAEPLPSASAVAAPDPTPSATNAPAPDISPKPPPRQTGTSPNQPREKDYGF